MSAWEVVSVVSDSVCDPVNYNLLGSSVHGILQNTAVGCHGVLQGIFPSQGSKLMSLMSPTSAGEFFASSTTQEAHLSQYLFPILLGMYLGVKFLPYMVTLLEEGMAIHSSILAWRIPQTEEPGTLQSIGVAQSRTQLSEQQHGNMLNFFKTHETFLQ